MKACFRVLKKGKHLSVALEMNLWRATILPVSDYTFLTIFGDDISKMAFTFFGLAFIPLYDTKKPRNFPEDTPNVHLVKFNFILYCLSVSKVSLRSSKWLSYSLLLSSILSTYTSTFLLIYLSNIWFTNLWHVAPAFFNPKGITLESCFLLIFFNHLYLVVLQESIHKGEEFMPCCWFNKLVDPRQREAIFRASTI